MDIILSQQALCAIFAQSQHPEYDSFCLARALDRVPADEHDGLLTRAILTDVDRFLTMVPAQPTRPALRTILWRHWLRATGEDENFSLLQACNRPKS